LVDPALLRYLLKSPDVLIPKPVAFKQVAPVKVVVTTIVVRTLQLSIERPLKVKLHLVFYETTSSVLTLPVIMREVVPIENYVDYDYDFNITQNIHGSPSVVRKARVSHPVLNETEGGSKVILELLCYNISKLLIIFARKTGNLKVIFPSKLIKISKLLKIAMWFAAKAKRKLGYKVQRKLKKNNVKSSRTKLGYVRKLPIFPVLICKLFRQIRFDKSEKALILSHHTLEWKPLFVSLIFNLKKSK